jgi:hypothetical protein
MPTDPGRMADFLERELTYLKGFHILIEPVSHSPKLTATQNYVIGIL